MAEKNSKLDKETIDKIKQDRKHKVATGSKVNKDNHGPTRATKFQ